MSAFAPDQSASFEIPTGADAAPCLLAVENLGKTYASAAGPVVALHPTTFRVREREIVAVVGPSGSGKTTLLGLCAGLDEPTAGRVWLEGACLTDLDEDGRARLRNRKVGFVFQNFQLLPSLTALENVMVPLELRGAGAARATARQWLAEVGLADRADHYPVQLSGGEQQRVALARAFVHGPRLLFADEPTGNLDGANRAHVAEILFRLNHSSGTTLILVTHDTELAGRAHRILRLQDGRLQAA